MTVMRETSSTRHSRNGEDGFLLLAVVVMCAVVLIALSVAAPIIAKDLRRDKEVESEHRMEEYVRAIQLYYRKNSGYPPSIKALESTNNVRYLRQKYKDPLTGDEYRIIHQGEQKTTVKGFFGQELSAIGGGAGGNLGSAAGMTSAGGTGVAASTISAGGLASGFDQATIGGTSGSTGSSGATSSTGSSSSSEGGMFGDSGGGGIIVGVGTNRTGNSILTPNQQTTYETWEFWYDPRIELLKKNVNILGRQHGVFLGNQPWQPGGFGQHRFEWVERLQQLRFFQQLWLIEFQQLRIVQLQ